MFHPKVHISIEMFFLRFQTKGLVQGTRTDRFPAVVQCNQDFSGGFISYNVGKFADFLMQNLKVNMKPDFEPYVVVKKTGGPLYDERFNGFGWNKVSYTMELESARSDMFSSCFTSVWKAETWFSNLSCFTGRYKFTVLPFAWAVHVGHGPSLELVNFRNGELYQRCLKMLKGQFIKELVRKYTVNNVNSALWRNRNFFEFVCIYWRLIEWFFVCFWKQFHNYYCTLLLFECFFLYFFTVEFMIFYFEGSIFLSNFITISLISMHKHVMLVVL